MRASLFEVNGKCGRQERQQEGGYVLLALLLFVALLSVGFLTVAQRIDFQIKRDREEEMIHRGVQYSRAVRSFVNQFHRYPNSIEELENTNNMRFLRRRYKDPITGKDFKILHLTDMPNFVSQPAPGVPLTNTASQSQAFQAMNSTAPALTGIGAATGAQSPVANDQPNDNLDAQGNMPQNSQNGSNVLAPFPSSSAQQETTPGDAIRAAQGIIIGVVSASKERAIREFSKQDRYSQWLFIYDPSSDRGGIMTTPSQPPMQVALQRNLQPNQSASPFGSPSGSNLTNPPTAASPLPTQQ